MSSPSQKQISTHWKWIAILAASLIFVCFSCVAASMAMDAMGLLPTATPSQTATLAIAETETPIPRQTQPTQSLSEYSRIASTRFELLQEEWLQFLAQHEQITQDINIVENNDFYFKTQSHLFGLEARTAELAAMTDFSLEYTSFNQTLILLKDETASLGQNYNLVLDNRDASALASANINIETIKTLIQTASEQLSSLTP